MADRTKPPSGLLVAGVVLLVLGLAGCGVGGWRVGAYTRSAVDAIGSAEPRPFGVALRFTALGEGAAVLLSTAAVCEATDGTGSRVALDPVWENVDKNFSDGTTTYTKVLGLETVEGRNYEVVCQATAGSGQYTVVPLPGRLRPVLLVGATGLLGGGALTLVAIVLLIASMIRRARWRRGVGAGAGGAVAPVSVGPPPAGMVTHGDVAPPPPPPGASASPSEAAPVTPPDSPPIAPPPGPPTGPPTGP